jgi:hypothetical protein
LFVEGYIGADLPKGLLPNNLRKEKRAAAQAVKILSDQTGKSQEEVERAVEQWANWYLEDVGKSLVSTACSLNETFEAWAEVLGIEDQKAFAKERFKILFGYGAFFNDFRQREWNRFAEFYGDLFFQNDVPDIEAHIAQTADRDPWEFSGSQNNDKPVMVFNPQFSIGSHPSKVGAWALRWPYLDTEVALLFDSGHRSTFESLMLTPYVMQLFEEQKSLGMVAPVYKTYYEDYTSASRALSRGHKVWDGRMRSVKEYIDTENDFGKKFIRVAAFTSSDAFIPEKNSEDTAGGNLMIQHGGHIRHTELVDIVQSVEKTHFYGRAFVERFGATVPELMTAVAWWKFLADPNVHWTVKFGTLRDFSHYIRIGLMAVSVFSFIIFFMMLPFSPYIYFPLAVVFALVNYIANQSVNSLTIEDYIADYGLVKGLLTYYKDFWNLLYTYISYEGANVLQFIMGMIGVNTFSFSSRMSNLARADFGSLYGTPTVRFSIKMAAFFLVPVLLAPYHPVAMLINGLFVILVLVWANPFFLNVRASLFDRHSWPQALVQLAADLIVYPVFAFILAWGGMLVSPFTRLLSIKKGSKANSKPAFRGELTTEEKTKLDKVQNGEEQAQKVESSKVAAAMDLVENKVVTVRGIGQVSLGKLMADKEVFMIETSGRSPPNATISNNHIYVFASSENEITPSLLARMIVHELIESALEGQTNLTAQQKHALAQKAEKVLDTTSLPYFIILGTCLLFVASAVLLAPSRFSSNIINSWTAAAFFSTLTGTAVLVWQWYSKDNLKELFKYSWQIIQYIFKVILPITIAKGNWATGYGTIGNSPVWD